jgi:hypothetical protein
LRIENWCRKINETKSQSLGGKKSMKLIKLLDKIINGKKKPGMVTHLGDMVNSKYVWAT